MDYASIIKEIGRGAKGARPMNAEQAEALFGNILDGKVPDMELGAILLSLRIKGESLDELLGFRQALDARTRQVSIPAGPRCVVLPTYNGTRKSANLMPLLALLLAQRGVPVLIQGRSDFPARHSVFDLLTALGIEPERSLPEAAAQLESRRLACLRLDMLARGLDWLLGLRTQLGVRNCGHTLAKLLDPCQQRSVRVIPVTHPAYMDAVQAVLAASSATALLMRATEGEAFAAPGRAPRWFAYQDGQLLDAPFTDEPDATELPFDGSTESNAALIRAMLNGEQAIPRPIAAQADLLTRLAQS